MNRKISEYKNARHLLTFRSRKTKQKFPFFLVGMSFLIPILLLLPGLIYMGIFPFGDLTTLTVDLRNQYVGFFEAMRNALQDPGSLLYNFTKGLGGVMSGTVAYYLTSPLNLLIFLFPSKDLPMAIELIQLLKVGLAGAFFAIFLIKKEHGDSILVLLFSVPYALMGFVVANLLNLMWLDPILLLPLIILMLERMFDGKSAIPYILLLAWSILTNFYAAYMLCLFLGLYAIWALIRRSGMHTRTRKAALKNAWHQFVYFGFSSLVAALLCAVILLPTGYSLMMSKGPYQDLIQYRWSNAYPWLDPLSR